MELSKKRAKQNLSGLLEKFERELVAGRIKDYLEEATKLSFIQPLLKDVLGWNVSNHDEVSPEEKVSRGRVDYALKVEGTIRVFIEAKPIKANLNKHIEQAIQYGYNKKSVPFVVLTDFEGLKLFDVTIKPDSRNLLKGLKLDLQWNQYLQQFDKLWLLSKESVIIGELDKLLLVKPKNRLPVDKAILDDLKMWRVNLANDVFKNNHKLFHSGDHEKDSNYLKEITQRILDRIIFMRSCEDRHLTHRRHLKELFEERTETVGKNTMIFLREEFKQYNIIFDSDLFRPQEWEENLAIDFKVMKDIILETYNPYQFDVIPLEVLGNIYEQYLGYTIRLTDHQVKYELKPDVRKAGGVYYTPEYIVDYIVKNTVGKFLQKLSPRRIKKLRILDPACGSGSFLIRAYEEMLNYYRNKKKGQKKSKHVQDKLDLKQPSTEPHLTIYEKSEILQNHIFGVDIDEQAVEVTKLSLMLKMLEGEYGFVAGRAILPMLNRNIRCGNSLISGDILEVKKYFGNDWYKVKPFNWDEAFRNIIVKEGGFDVIIGNPPWVSLKGKHKSLDLSNEHLDFFLEKYKCNTYMPNIYELFIQRCLTLIKEGGYFSFIVPDRLCANRQFINLRKNILENYSLINLWFRAPFPGVIADTIVFVIENKKSGKNIVKICEYAKTKFIKIPQRIFYNTSDYAFFFVDENLHQIFKRIRSEPSIKNLNQIVLSTSGCGAKSNKITKIKKNKRQIQILKGKSILKYTVRSKFWFEFIDQNLSGRTKDKKKLGKKYKVLLRKTGADLIGTFDDTEIYPEQSLYFLYTEDDNNRKLLLYILGILNSRLMNCYYRNFAVTNRDSTPQLKNIDLDKFPIKQIDFSNPSDKMSYNSLTALIEIMLNLNKKIQTSKGTERKQIRCQIEKTDKEIDNLVYRLYGITNKEREIIERK